LASVRSLLLRPTGDTAAAAAAASGREGAEWDRVGDEGAAAAGWGDGARAQG